jgi:hypothetical protein
MWSHTASLKPDRRSTGATPLKYPRQDSNTSYFPKQSEEFQECAAKSGAVPLPINLEDLDAAADFTAGLLRHFTGRAKP